MENKTKKFYVIDIGIAIILILSNLLIGSPLKYNIDVLNIVINIVAIIYIGYNYIKNKTDMKLNKIDICVIIIALSTFIPLISNKYLRLRDTVYYIIKYISMINLYFIIKKYIKTDKNNIQIITNIIIIMSIILIIFGIDLLTFNFFEKIYEFFLMPELYNKSTYSMSSLFKYSNAFAVFESFVLLLTLGSYLKEDKKRKLKKSYGMCIFFQMFGILASYSRMSIICLIFLIIVLWILAKEKRKDILRICIISSISAFIYFVVFTKFRISGNFLAALIALGITVILNYFLVFEFKIKNKQNLLIIVLMAILLIILMIILTPKNLILFDSVKAKSSFRKQNIKVKANTQYAIQVDLKSVSKQSNNFAICIKELDHMENQTKETIVEFDNYDGIKEMNITTEDNTKNISLLFKCYNISNDTSLEIRNVYINKEKINVYYGLIPVELINKIQKISIDSRSVKSRIEYLKEGLKICKNNLLFGLGGNAWRFIPKNMTIEDSIAEHSYPMQLLIQFGITTLISYVLLIIFLIIEMKKYLRENKKDFLAISICLAIFMIVLHSLIDFEMSFFNIFLTFYMYIAISSTMIHKENKRISYKWMYVYEIILIVFLYINIGGLVAYNIEANNIKMINIQITLAPYDYSYRKDKVNYLSTLKNTNFYAKNSAPYYNACKDIINQQKFIIEKEKLNKEYEYRTLLYNTIDLITEENQEQILSEITAILNSEISLYNEEMINGLSIMLLKNLDNDNINEYIEMLNSKV